MLLFFTYNKPVLSLITELILRNHFAYQIQKGFHELVGIITAIITTTELRASSAASAITTRALVKQKTNTAGGEMIDNVDARFMRCN